MNAIKFLVCFAVFVFTFWLFQNAPMIFNAVIAIPAIAACWYLVQFAVED